MPIDSFYRNLAVVVGLLFLDVQGARACNCPERPFRIEVQQTDLICKGKILKSEENQMLDIMFVPFHEIIYTVSLEKIYKGTTTRDTIYLITDKPYHYNCVKKLIAGDTYLIYARYEISMYSLNADNSPKILFTDACTRTDLFTSTDPEELQLLEQLAKPKNANNHFFGKNTMTMIWVILTSLLITFGVLYIRKIRKKTTI
jgi:hypothetical protein